MTRLDDTNDGFLHVEAGKWRLSPAFDVNPLPDRVRELTTWITDDSGPAATVEALLSAIEYFAVPAQHARNIIGVVKSAVARWREVAQEVGMTVLGAAQPTGDQERRTRHLASSG